MPVLPTGQEWLAQSTLLLQARPITTRITTKYTHPRLPNSKVPASKKPKSTPPTDSSKPIDPTKQAQPTATLTLKTYDPVSGTILKYNTNKSAEVGRLIQILGRLARPMAGLPEMKEDVVMLDVKVEGEGGSGVGTPVVEADKQLGKPVPAVGGGGGKKKKGKGKK